MWAKEQSSLLGAAFGDCGPPESMIEELKVLATMCTMLGIGLLHLNRQVYLDSMHEVPSLPRGPLKLLTKPR